LHLDNLPNLTLLECENNPVLAEVTLLACRPSLVNNIKKPSQTRLVFLDQTVADSHLRELLQAKNSELLNAKREIGELEDKLRQAQLTDEHQQAVSELQETRRTLEEQIKTNQLELQEAKRILDSQLQTNQKKEQDLNEFFELIRKSDLLLSQIQEVRQRTEALSISHFQEEINKLKE
jgi:hypothetical protein